MADIKKQSILITGATGFIGKHIAKNLLNQGHNLYILMRNPFKFKKDNIIKFLTAENKELKGRITIIEGDITDEKVVTKENDLKLVTSEVTSVYHCAGLYNLNLLDEELMTEINVTGTTNILNFIKKSKNINKLNYISTAFVAGKYEHLFYEDDLDKNQEFNNCYEQSKYIAEKLVRSAKKEIPTTIFRPTIVIGNSVTGEAERKDGLYYLLDFVHNEKELLKKVPFVNSFHHAFPGSNNTFLNVVPVDFVADAIAYIGEHKDSMDKTFCIGDPFPLTLKEMTELVYDEYKMPKPLLNFNPKWIDSGMKIPVFRKFVKFALDYIDIPADLIPYLYAETEFDCSNTEELLKNSNIECPTVLNYIPKVIDYYEQNLVF